MAQTLSSRILEELVYGGHLSSLGFSSLALTPLLLLDRPVSPLLLSIPYLMTQTVYSYNHSREMRFDMGSNPERARHLQKLMGWSSLSPFLYAAVLAAVLCFTNLRLATLAALLVAGGIVYTNGLKTAATRVVPGFKTAYTSLLLALCVFTVPLFLRAPVTPFFLWFFAFAFMRACINTAFSDIKDVEADAERGLKTIPVLLGKAGTIRLLHIANLASLVVLIAGVCRGCLPREALLLAVSVAYDMAYLAAGSVLGGRKLRILSYAVADAELWLWPLVIATARAAR